MLGEQGVTIGVVMLTISCAGTLLACGIIACQRQCRRRDAAQMKGGASVRLQVPRDTNTRRAMLRQTFAELMTADTAEVAAWSAEERCFTATRNGYTQDRGDIDLLQHKHSGRPADPPKPGRGPNRDSPSRGSFANHTPPPYLAATTTSRPAPECEYAELTACTTRAPASANYGALLPTRLRVGGRTRRERIDDAMAAAFSAHGLPLPPRTPPRPSLRSGPSTGTPGVRSPVRVRFQSKSPLVTGPKVSPPAQPSTPEHARESTEVEEATYELVTSRRYTDEGVDDVEAGISRCKDRDTVSTFCQPGPVGTPFLPFVSVVPLAPLAPFAPRIDRHSCNGAMMR